MTEHDATLERRLYARIDEVLGPINIELDAVNARLTALAASYEALSTSMQRVAISAPTSAEFQSAMTRLSSVETRAADAHRRCDALTSTNERLGADVTRIVDLGAQLEGTDARISANFHSFKGVVDGVLETHEAQFEHFVRRDKQVELQLEGLARDVVGLQSNTAVGALRDEVQQLSQAVATARSVNVEQTARIGCIEEWRRGHVALTSALETRVEELTHAHAKNGDAVLADESSPPIYLGDVAFLQEFGPNPVRATSGTSAPASTSYVVGGPWDDVDNLVDIYEVDGRPATKAEYEAAENDASRHHTTRHVHRPFSDGADLGDNFRERERIKRQQMRWLLKLSKMPRDEQLAMLKTLNGLAK